MSDQTDLFNKEETTVSETVTTTTPVEGTPVQQAGETYQEYLARIKNEDGLQKYASVEDALTGALHAQEYISEVKPKLSAYEQQVEELKQELEKRMSVEDAMERLASRKEELQTSNPGLTREDVQAILRAEEQEKVFKQNRQEVSAALIKFYGEGEKASQAIQEKSKELGLSLDDISQLAAKSPTSTMKLLGLEETLRSKPSSQGSLNSEALAQHNSQNPVKKDKSLLGFKKTSDLVQAVRNAREEVLSNLNN
jgi:AraC-like DNA-binding protein